MRPLAILVVFVAACLNLGATMPTLPLDLANVRSSVNLTRASNLTLNRVGSDNLGFEPSDPWISPTQTPYTQYKFFDYYGPAMDSDDMYQYLQNLERHIHKEMAIKGLTSDAVFPRYTLVRHEGSAGPNDRSHFTFEWQTMVDHITVGDLLEGVRLTNEYRLEYGPDQLVKSARHEFVLAWPHRIMLAKGVIEGSRSTLSSR